MAAQYDYENEENYRIKFQLLIIKLYADGMKGPEISDMVEVPSSTIYDWISKYKQYRRGGLVNKPRDGRPRKVDYKDLKEVLSSDPLEVGYNTLVWTVDLIKQYLKEHQNVEISTSYAYQLLDRLGVELDCSCINCLKTRSQITTVSGSRITPLHFKVLEEANILLDAPVDKIITEKGIKPVLKVISQNKDRTVLEGTTENGKLTLIYDHDSASK